MWSPDEGNQDVKMLEGPTKPFFIGTMSLIVTVTTRHSAFPPTVRNTGRFYSRLQGRKNPSTLLVFYGKGVWGTER